MSKTAFERYGDWATIDDPLYASARPPQIRSRERLILADVAAKLELKPDDRVLDIGAGIGTLTIPMSFMVSTVTAVDHPACLARLKKRAPEAKITLVEADFLKTDIKESFSKILAYDVFQYLSSMDDAALFLNKALILLERHGRMLVGDLPNNSLKKRYELTPEGQTYARKWNKDFEVSSEHLSKAEYERLEPLDTDRKMIVEPCLGTFDDDQVMSIMSNLRAADYQAWLLPQPKDLPFGKWREDLLIVRP